MNETHTNTYTQFLHMLCVKLQVAIMIWEGDIWLANYREEISQTLNLRFKFKSRKRLRLNPQKVYALGTKVEVP